MQRNPIQKIIRGKGEGEAIERENIYKEYWSPYNKLSNELFKDLLATFK